MKKLQYIFASFIISTNLFSQEAITQDNIQSAVNAWLDDSVSTEATYGYISDWDVSNVTDMSGMFAFATSFNGDLSSWDVSSVTDMSQMFYGASSFNGDLSSWDVSSVVTMQGMFDFAHSFNGDLSSWDVSSVTNMSMMFNGATSFNEDLSDWDVSNVTNMGSMFNEATIFNGDISSWDVSSVTNMASMFRGATSFNSDISSWDVSSVTNMIYMLSTWGDSATSFNGDLSSWDVSSVTNMGGMFNNASSFNGDLSNWDVSSVTNMFMMFDGTTSLSEVNQCAIQTSFSTNSNWPYEWECALVVINGCTDETAFNYNAEANTDDGSCLEEVNVVFDPVSNITNITSIYNIYILNLSLGGVNITLGDLIGVFYILNGELVCGGNIIYDGTGSGELVLIGDDPATPEVEGFIEGQEIIWIVQQTDTDINFFIDLDSEVEVFTNNIEQEIILEEVSTTYILGCTDTFAINYNELANTDDGSCDYANLVIIDYEELSGSNFHFFAYINGIPSVTFLLWNMGDGTTYQALDDPTHYYQENGTYQVSVNVYSTTGAFIAYTTVDVTNVSYGCMDDSSINFDPIATTDDGSCIAIIEGCTDETAFNYNTEANTDDGSCIAIANGCTDEISLNYDAFANTDDGSCIEEVNIVFESVPEPSNITSTYNVYILNLSLGGVNISIGDLIGVFYILNGELVCGGYVVYDGSSPVEISVNGDDPATPEVDGFIEGQEIIWIVQQTDTETNYVCEVDSEGDVFTPNVEEDIIIDEVDQTTILGCTDSLACNYNPESNLDDGACKYPQEFIDCYGDCINDFDMDGVCDEVDYDDGIGIDDIESQEPLLIRMIDILGREQHIHADGVLLFYLYDNGKVEKILKR